MVWARTSKIKKNWFWLGMSLYEDEVEGDGGRLFRSIVRGALSRSPVLLYVTVREHVVRADRVPLRVLNACTLDRSPLEDLNDAVHEQAACSCSVCKKIFSYCGERLLSLVDSFSNDGSLSLSPLCTWRAQGEWPRSWSCHTAHRYHCCSGYSTDLETSQLQT